MADIQTYRKIRLKWINDEYGRQGLFQQTTNKRRLKERKEEKEFSN